MGKETEFKLAVAGEALLAQILSGAQIAACRQSPFTDIRMRTTYYDTLDGFFSARRWMLRMRMENARSVVTMKTPGEGHTRGEWECGSESLAAALPELLRLGAPEALRTLDPAQLIPVCGAGFTRRTAPLQLPDGTRCMVCGDCGLLSGGGRTQPLCELELELVSGSETALAAFAAQLAAAYHLQEQPQSKLQRARALL